MVPFKGRLGINKFISNKPVHFGVRLWELSESATGYCYKFDVYIGKSKNDTNLVLGKSATVVLETIMYILITIILLFHCFLALAEKGIGACGTIRANRKHYPKDVLAANVKCKCICLEI